MLNKGYQEIKDELIRLLKSYFGEKIGSFTIIEQTDTPYTMLSFEFSMYKYFYILLSYDRGRFGCSIISGNKTIPLENSQKWYDTAKLDVFLEELEQQIELRIPDKLLEYYGWKK